MGAAPRLGERGSARQHLPHDPVTAFAIFKLAAGGHRIAGALSHAVNWKIRAPRIPDGGFVDRVDEACYQPSMFSSALMVTVGTLGNAVVRVGSSQYPFGL